MNIFETKAEMPKEPSKTEFYGIGMSVSKGPSDAPVRVTMTPDEMRALAMSNYPRYDAMDTHHAPVVNRGKHY